MSTFTLGAIELPSGKVIDQLDNVTLANGLVEMIRGVAGSVDPEFIANISQEPVLSFGTTQVKDVCDLTFIDGLPVVAGDPIILWFREIAAGATLTAIASGSHIKVTCYNGVLLLDSIDASLNEPSTCAATFHILYDGTNNPFVVEMDQAYVPTPGAGQYFRLGAGWLESVALARLQQFSLQTGLGLDKQFEAGSIWPVQASILNRQPMWTWTTLETDIMDSLPDPTAGKVPGLLGKSIDFSGKNTRAHLQSVVKGGELDLIGNATHLRFEVAEGKAKISDANFTPNQTAPVTVEIKPTWDGSATALMTYGGGVAIAVA